MPIKKFKALSPDPFINKIPGDTEFARLAHLNNLVDQINSQAAPPPPPSTNIYNSNGTLIGNRILSGANNSLFFTNISTFALLTKDQFSLTNYDSNNQILFSGLPNYNGLIQYTNFNNSNLNTSFIVGNSIVKTQYGSLNNDIGLKLDFANNLLDFGYNINEGVFRVNKSGVNTFFQTIHNIEIKGLYFNFTANQFDFGRKNGGNLLQIRMNDGANRIYVESLNNNVGINLSINSRLYQFGQITGSNQTTITIDDAAAYPVQLTGTNISSGTAGAASGQFLKIKVGGVDYKIALLNP